jgi:hypothetical protein
MLHFVDVARALPIEPWKIISAGLTAIWRWRWPGPVSVSGMSAEWLAEHESRSAKRGGQL